MRGRSVEQARIMCRQQVAQASAQGAADIAHASAHKHFVLLGVVARIAS